MEITCKRCGYNWQYKGEQEYYCTCPKCLIKVKIGELPKRGQNITKKVNLKLRD